MFMLLRLIAIVLACGLASPAAAAETASDAGLMLEAPWVPEDVHSIDFAALPRLPLEHRVVSDVRAAGGVNQHNYLAHFAGGFWLMWSDGPGVEDRVGQRVRFARSEDGLNWSNPEFLTPPPPGSDTDSAHYGTRSSDGFRYIARGFWEREGSLLALASLDEAGDFFGPSLELRAFRFREDTNAWEDAGQVFDDTINNFPPKRLESGDWMMSRRTHKRDVYFLIGGVTALDAWEAIPAVTYGDAALAAEEPYWWALPDGDLMALYRDNRKSRFLYRAFSTDLGRTWSRPVRTNFPDATSKFHGLRLEDGRYILVSNANPAARDPLVLSLSDDGRTFHTMWYLIGGRHVDYPHCLEHDGHLIVAFSGGKQSVEVLKIPLTALVRTGQAEVE